VALLLIALMFGFMLAIVMAIGAGEHLTGGDLQQVQDKLRGWFGVPATIIISLVGLMALVAKLNIMAKRIRDIGLSGWWVVVALVLLTGLTGQFHEGETGAGLTGVVFLLVVLIPSNAIGGKT
jgi:uncharacterized membrane protein YhaH (DUF805 family)